MSAPAHLNASLAGKYQIQREIGHGGMATVYLARDQRHDRLVAIKVLHTELAAAVGAERFLREIRIAAKLAHPHILTLIDSGVVEGPEGESTLFYVMPFIEGESLRDRLVKAGGPISVSEATRLLRDVVDGIAHAHAHGVVHRDIKPDNVMVSGRHAMVVDFGVAKAISAAKDTQGLTSIGLSIGTPAYMAPEQASADPGADHRVDIYAAGIVAYELLTGTPPFTGSHQQVLSAHITLPPRPLAQVRPDLPAALAEIVMRCLEKDPDARFQSANELLERLESLTTPSTLSMPSAARRGISRGALAGAAAVIFIAALVPIVIAAGGRKERWVRDEAVPAIRRLTADGKMDSAFTLAATAVERAPDDTVVRALWRRASAPVPFRTEPPGARVSRATFEDTTVWHPIGTTPIDSVRVPLYPSASRYRIELPGYRTVNLLMPPQMVPRTPIVLDSVTAPNPEMVRVGGGEMNGALPGIDNVKPVQLSDFFMDRHETTNAQYKAFVDAGGYTRKEFWTEPIVQSGRVLPWADAMRSFVDRTGRPGPASWEGGAPPSGQNDLPVGGVSWYEATAYAKFAGKALPTVFQWNRAARVDASAWVVPGSTFDASGPTRGGTTRGMSPWGNFDMAGNVREWIYNQGRNGRYILGGAWSDPSWMFVDAYTQDPMNRAAINGIRLAKYRDEPNLAIAKRPIIRAFRDFSKERPVSDAVYASFRSFYDYDRRPLHDSIVSRDSSAEDWVRERVIFDAAYGGERVPAMLFLPKRARPPYQVVVFFPGSGALNSRNSGTFNTRNIDFILAGGRAVIVPIYKSTYERQDSLKTDYSDESNFYRDHVVMWSKDMRRAIDYLATRPDIDTTRIAYMGFSWGGYLGGLMPATEPRIKAAILYVAGLEMERAKPEADPINFLPRITIPVIMLNGKHDYFFPVETSQEPMFRMLGTPPEHKKWVVYEGGHFVPRTQLIKESLDWLDKYLGPVR